MQCGLSTGVDDTRFFLFSNIFHYDGTYTRFGEWQIMYIMRFLQYKLACVLIKLAFSKV